MRITVLDGYTLNPGDNPWTELEKLGELTVYDRTPASKILERARGAQVILTNKTPLSAETLAALPDLRFIAVLATGYNVVDVAAAARRNVPVANVPAYGTQSVAQHTFALILELCNSVGLHHRSVQEGQWAASRDFCFWNSPVIELSGKTIGIIGAGRIGRAVGNIAQAFGMKVCITPRRSGDCGCPECLQRRDAWVASNRSRAASPVAGWQVKTAEEIFREADMVTLHCPQTAANTGFVNRCLLKTMKPGAFLINTARGGLIVEEDLAKALREGWLSGAAVDVVSSEPVKADNPLLVIPHCIITPHIAWSSLAARRRIMETTRANICGFLNGQIQNRVN